MREQIVFIQVPYLFKFQQTFTWAVLTDRSAGTFILETVKISPIKDVHKGAVALQA